MNSVVKGSSLTSKPRTRPRLQFEFRARRPRAAGREGPPRPDLVDLFLENVSVALSEPASSRVAAEFEDRLAEAVDADLKTWTRDVGRSPLGAALATWWPAVKTCIVEAALDPQTWRTAEDDVGRHPSVGVSLLLPGSYARSTKVTPVDDVDVAFVYRGGERAGQDVDRLAEAMTPEFSVPSPPVVLQARRNAEARTEVLTEFGALTAAQVAELSGSEAKNRSALAGRWRREGRLLVVEHHGTVYYPGFQFDAHGQPRPAVEQVLKHLDAPPWQQVLWFTTASGWLDGRRPVDLLDVEPDAVVDAARAFASEPVG